MSRAFCKWFAKQYETRPERAAAYIVAEMREGHRDSIVWDYLKLAGKNPYDLETIVKAVQLIINDAKKEPQSDWHLRE